MAESNSSPYTPATILEQLIEKGDVDGTVAHLETLGPAERARHRAPLARARAAMHQFVSVRVETEGYGVTEEFRTKGSPDQLCALAIAVMVCGPVRKSAEAFYEDDRLFAALARLRPDVLTELPDALLAIHPNRILLVQRLIVSGLSARPSIDAYFVGLIALPQILSTRERFDAFVARDPGLLQVFPRVFDVEGTGDTSLATIEKYSHQSVSWTSLFLGWCADGVYSRASLLERSLGALERGWIQHRSGWFSRFHDALAPSVEEMRPHLPRYLGLCASRIPPTVTMALQALKKLDDASPIDADTLLSALELPASSAVKGQVDGVLKMLVTIVHRQPDVARRAANVALKALGHESKDIQATVLKLLKHWGVDGEQTDALKDYLPGIAATNRPLLMDLIGGEQATPATAARGVAALSSTRSEARVAFPLDDGYRLQPVGTCLELVELIAHVFENDSDVDALEQAIAALVALSPISAADRPRFSPVMKRAAKLRKPIPQELARLVALVVDGERRVKVGGYSAPVHEFLTERVSELMALAIQGKRLVPLATPTHRNGFIDATVLVARIRQYLEAGVSAGPLDAALALLRLSASDGALERARGLPDSLLTRALRYALGDDITPGRDPLYTAAARIRCRGIDDEQLLATVGDNGPDGARIARYSWDVRTTESTVAGKTYYHHNLFVASAAAGGSTPMELLSVWRHPRDPEKQQFGRFWTFAGGDEAGIRYSATLLPTDIAAFCAEGVRVVGNNLDWWEAQWSNKAYIEILLQPTTNVSGMAVLLLVLSLAGKEPGQTAIAVDALASSWREQRLDGEAVAETLARLIATPLIKIPRLTKSLLATLRLEPTIEGFLFEVLSDGLGRTRGTPVTDVAPLLELMVELKVRQSRMLPPAAANSLATMALKGKAVKHRAELLATN